MQKNKKLLLTGGHAATTAYAVMQEIKKQNKDWKLFWIGAKVTLEGVKSKNFEEELFKDYEVENYHITAGKIQKKVNLSSVVSLFKIPFGFFSAFRLIRKINPDVILSFGGYVSYPVVVSAKILGKPIVIHEQTSAAGIANIKASKFASQVAVSRDSSIKYFPKDKCTLTGNPVSSEIASLSAKIKIGDPPAILVTGGSRGSQIINKTVFNSLEVLTKNYKIFHLTGDLDFKKATDLKNKLNSRNRYIIYDFVSPNKMVELFDNADIVVSRAGANTVSEIITSSRPAVLIPIPWTHYNEQTKNAEYAKEAGIAIILEEKNLDKNNLMKALSKVKSNWKKMSQSVSMVLNNDEHAAGEIVQIVDKYI